MGFEGASTGRRNARWVTTASDLNTILAAEGDELRRRSRDMARKNPWASNAIESFVGNCIGTGIKPQPQHPNPRIRKQLAEWWTRWTDEADSANLTDLYGLQSLACRGAVEAGETLIRLRTRRPEDRMFVPLQLQVLEAEHLPLEKTELLPNGNRIDLGIEFNLIGKRDAYHLYREHPGSDRGALKETVRVPAENVLHLYKPIRAEQGRGQPWMSPVLVKLYELDQYDDAELVRKKTAAMITHFITEPNPLDPLGVGDAVSEDDEDGTPLSAIQPGSTVKLLEGEAIQVSQAADVGQQYEAFMRVQLRAIAAGLGITYEMLTGDLTGVNFSSSRVGRDEVRRRIEAFQHQVMVYQFCRPVWKAFVEHCVLAGLISAVDYNRNAYNYLNCLWRAPHFPWVNPIQDLKTQVGMVRAGFKPLSAVINELGEDPDAVLAQIARDNAAVDALGLSFDSDGRRPESGPEPEAPQATE